MILRPHQEDNCVVFEAVTRSWRPITPLPLRWDFPLWRRARELDPAALKGKKPRYEERQEDRDKLDRLQIARALQSEPDTVRASNLASIWGKRGLSDW